MFGVRLASSAVLVVLALIFLILGGKLLGIVTILLSLVAFHELMHACGIEKNGEAGSSDPDGEKTSAQPGALEWVGYAGIILYGVVMMLTKDFSLGMGCMVLLFLAEMFVYVFRFPHYTASQVMPAFFCAFYPTVLFSYVYLTRELTHGVYLVWLIFISSWICDTCAYCTGMLFGKHKLAPVLSPKKSIEGSIGGVAGSALVGALFAWIFLVPATQDRAVVGLVALISAIGAVISQVGDLAASAIKRNHDIKDYGKLIPGHGGIMDRFDSVLFTAPIIYYLSVLFLRVGL